MSERIGRSLKSVIAILLMALLWPLENTVVYSQTRPSPPVLSEEDPAFIRILLWQFERGEAVRAEEILKANLARIKPRLEAVIAEIDREFDILGRFGAVSIYFGPGYGDLETSNEQYEKLFDLYRRLSGDEDIYKRFEARKLRVEGAHFTNQGEIECGDQFHTMSRVARSIEHLGARDAANGRIVLQDDIENAVVLRAKCAALDAAMRRVDIDVSTAYLARIRRGEDDEGKQERFESQGSFVSVDVPGGPAGRDTRRGADDGGAVEHRRGARHHGDVPADAERRAARPRPPGRPQHRRSEAARGGAAAARREPVAAGLASGAGDLDGRSTGPGQRARRGGGAADRCRRRGVRGWHAGRLNVRAVIAETNR